MGKILYIETNNGIITESRYLNTMNVDDLSGKTYERLTHMNTIAYIVNISKYIKNYSKINFPFNIHSEIINHGRRNKLKIIKNKINGSSI